MQSTKLSDLDIMTTVQELTQAAEQATTAAQEITIAECPDGFTNTHNKDASLWKTVTINTRPGVRLKLHPKILGVKSA